MRKGTTKKLIVFSLSCCLPTISTLIGCKETMEKKKDDIPRQVTEENSNFSFRSITCEQPELRQELGPFYEWTSTEWDEQTIDDDPNQHLFSGWGLIAEDFNGDHIPELIFPRFSSIDYWVSDADGWSKKDNWSIQPLSLGGVVADINADGISDVVVVGSEHPHVLTHDGMGEFSKSELVIHEAGDMWDIDPSPVYSIAMGDIDNDDDLDIFLPRLTDLGAADLSNGLLKGTPSNLLRNEGDGTFLNVTDWLPTETNDGDPFVAALIDVDADNDLDLMVANDSHNNVARLPRLWLNDGTGHFEDTTANSNIDVIANSMGLGIGDLNHDLTPDFIISDVNRIVILESSPNLQWTQTQAARGVQFSDPEGMLIGWGVELADIDNDADLDFWTGYGWWIGQDRDAQRENQPDQLWMQNSAGMFEDAIEELGLSDEGIGRGGLLIDLNDDGWLDIVRRRTFQRPRIDLARCGDASWFSLRLAQDGPNPSAIGSKVTVTTDNQTQIRWLIAGGHSVSSGGPHEVHFGLGDATIIDQVTVDWPDGTQSILHDVPVNGKGIIHR